MLVFLLVQCGQRTGVKITASGAEAPTPPSGGCIGAFGFAGLPRFGSQFLRLGNQSDNVGVLSCYGVSESPGRLRVFLHFDTHDMFVC